ncbi:MAG: PqiC family protein [Opitutaceae bacterium]
MNSRRTFCRCILCPLTRHLSPVTRHLLPATCLLICLLTLSGCSLPKPQPDPTRFFVLSTAAVRATPVPNAPVVHLREVELASYLRTRPVIVRRGENEIEFREFALWGEPLEMGIARVLREELLARGAASGVVSSPGRREQANAELNLGVRVLACEGGANGEVVFRAVWEVATTGAPATAIARGDFRPADLRWDGKTEASLAAQLSQAVAGLAGEIAGAIGRK